MSYGCQMLFTHWRGNRTDPTAIRSPTFVFPASGADKLHVQLWWGHACHPMHTDQAALPEPALCSSGTQNSYRASGQDQAAGVPWGPWNALCRDKGPTGHPGRPTRAAPQPQRGSARRDTALGSLGTKHGEAKFINTNLRKERK